MKAIILAAGEGKRMRPLTLSRPKPMIEVLGRPLLHHIIDSLPNEIAELVLVVGYKQDIIRSYFGERFEGRPVTYVVQEKPLGTAHALGLCRHLIKPGERFLFTFADDLHSPSAIKQLLRHPIGMLVQEHAEPSRFGVIETDAHGRVIRITEKPVKPQSNLVTIGMFLFDDRIFAYQAKQHESGEYFLTDQIDQLIREHEFVIERTNFWHPIGYPEDIEVAEKILHKGVPSNLSTVPAIILSGGKGTRMPEEEKHLPKSLVHIAGKPILERHIQMLFNQGIRRIRLSLGHKSEQVVEWLTTHTWPGVEIDYVVETEPLGTGGGIKFAARGFDMPFLAFNGDNLNDWDTRAIIRHGDNGRCAVISGFELDDASAYGLLEIDEHKRIIGFKEKQPNAGRGLINSGMYYLRPQDLAIVPDTVFSIEKDLFPKLAMTGELVLCKMTGKYFFDCGTPERLKVVREYFSKFHA